MDLIDPDGNGPLIRLIPLRLRARRARSAPAARFLLGHLDPPSLIYRREILLMSSDNQRVVVGKILALSNEVAQFALERQSLD